MDGSAPDPEADPATGEYRLTPEDFAEELLPALQEGIAYLGGCCGTTPDFIRVLRERLASPALSGDQPLMGSEKHPRKDGVCSATNTAVFDGVRVIGERINPTGKKRFQQALREQDLDYIVARGLEQQDAGADILDVNVGLPGIDEPAMMARTVKALQAVIDLPLQIDSSNPEAIEAGLRAVNGRAIVNSVSGKAESLETILPLCRKYGAKVVGLCLDENGIPETWQARAAIAARILNAALKIGMPKEDVLIDCLTLTVSVQQNQAAETLKAVRHVRETLGLHTVLGVSSQLSDPGAFRGTRPADREPQPGRRHGRHRVLPCALGRGQGQRSLYSPLYLAGSSSENRPRGRSRLRPEPDRLRPARSQGGNRPHDGKGA